MNRSMLIIITDFLLLSLLTFAKFDQVQPEQHRPLPAGGTNPLHPSKGDTDVLDVLKMSLDEERLAREHLTSKLGTAEEALRNRENVITEDERRIAEAQQHLQRKEEESRNLEKSRASLQDQLGSARTNLSRLQQQVEETAASAKVSATRAETLTADLQARQEEAERLKRQVDDLEKKRQAAEADRQKLATQLQLAETEKRLTREQLEAARGEVQVARGEVQAARGEVQAARGEVQVARQEVQVVRKEKAQIQEQTTKLAKGVSDLAEKSGELTKEIRENRPLAPNAIFSEFRTNRVETSFKGGRAGVFGQAVNKEKEAKTILVSDGQKTFGIYHIDDTPLAFTTPGMEWRQFTGTLRREGAAVPIARLHFLDNDPRVVLVPVPPPDATKLKAKIYPVTKDPFKFQEAVLVGANEGYYGECKFQIDPEMPQYVRMHRGIFSRLVGNFAPSTGDLVLSKTGELLGVMVNKQYCLVLSSLGAGQSLTAGDDLTTQPTGKLLSQLHYRVGQLPFKLQ